jgi:hypothetical protein
VPSLDPFSFLLSLSLASCLSLSPSSFSLQSSCSLPYRCFTDFPPVFGLFDSVLFWCFFTLTSLSSLFLLRSGSFFASTFLDLALLLFILLNCHTMMATDATCRLATLVMSSFFPRSLDSRSVNNAMSHGCTSKLHFFTMFYD